MTTNDTITQFQSDTALGIALPAPHSLVPGARRLSGFVNVPRVS
jgi:hypothetical protein